MELVLKFIKTKVEKVFLQFLIKRNKLMMQNIFYTKNFKKSIK